MWQLALIAATSALPKVIVVFQNQQDAVDVGLPAMFVTSLAHNWSTYDCSNTASTNGQIVCNRQQIACLPNIVSRDTVDDYDWFSFPEPRNKPTTSSSSVPIKII